MNLADALDTVRRVAAVRTTDVQTLALARAHRRVLAEPIGTPGVNARVALAPGRVLTPMRVAQATGAGVEMVRVRRRPTVAVFEVADEPGRAAGAAQALLVGLLRADGLEPTAWPVLPADARSVEIAIRDAGCAFDAIAVCGDAGGLRLVDGVLAAFGDVRVPALEVEGEAAAMRFATLDAACVLALPVAPAALTGLYLTVGRTLVDALEVRTEARPSVRGRVAGPRLATGAFEWARGWIDESGASRLSPLGADADHAEQPPNAVLLPEHAAGGGQRDGCVDAWPLPPT